MKKKLIYLSVLCILISLSFGCSPTGLNENGDADAAKRPVQEVRVVKEISMPGDIPFITYRDPVLVGDNMYVCVSDSYGPINKVINYDFNRREYSIVFQSQLADPILTHTMANDKWVIWLEHNGAGLHNTIYLLNRETNEILKLLESNIGIISPRLSGNYVTSVVPRDKEVPGSQRDIILWNLDTMESFAISDFGELSFYNTFVFINNEQVLWTDSVDGVGYYKIYDIETGLIKEIEAPYTYPGYAMMDGEKIYSINFQDHRYWTNQDFGYFDTSTNKYSSLMDVLEARWIARFRVSNNLVVAMYEMDEKGVIKIIDVINDKVVSFSNPLDAVDSFNLSIDTINVSHDGRIVIGREQLGMRNATLFILEAVGG